MKISVTLTIEVDDDAWRTEYGIDEGLRQDVKEAVFHTVYGQYGPDGRGVVTDVTLK